MKGVLVFVGSLGLSCLYYRFCPFFAVLVGPVQHIFFLVVHYFNSFVPIAQQAEQAVVLGRLSLSMCLWIYLISPVSWSHLLTW
jgi:hypothetical protein